MNETASGPAVSSAVPEVINNPLISLQYSQERVCIFLLRTACVLLTEPQADEDLFKNTILQGEKINSEEPGTTCHLVRMSSVPQRSKGTVHHLSKPEQRLSNH